MILNNEKNKDEAINDEKVDLEENQEQEAQDDQKESGEEKPAEENKEDESLQNQLIRLQADFDNFRKRTIREKDEIYKYALEDFSSNLLPVLDNLERAVSSLEKSKIEDEYASGVKMVLTQLKDVLAKEGLSEIECENQEFDPNLHHGVTVEDSDIHKEDEIIEVFQKGYTFKEKVIRPAMVKICKKS
jgi:molecular chaperone GrpE